MFLRVSIVAALVCFSIFLGRLWVDSGPLRLASSTNNRADELTSTLLIGGARLGVEIETGDLKVLHVEGVDSGEDWGGEGGGLFMGSAAARALKPIFSVCV